MLKPTGQAPLCQSAGMQLETMWADRMGETPYTKESTAIIISSGYNTGLRTFSYLACTHFVKSHERKGLCQHCRR